MFATFSMLPQKLGVVHGFSRLFLYRYIILGSFIFLTNILRVFYNLFNIFSFVMLFIYVVLSLFIAIIMDTYENIKEYYKVSEGAKSAINSNFLPVIWNILIRFQMNVQEGFPRSRVDDFYKAIQYDPYSDMFFDGSKPSYLYNCWANLMLR